MSAEPSLNNTVTTAVIPVTGVEAASPEEGGSGIDSVVWPRQLTMRLSRSKNATSVLAGGTQLIIAPSKPTAGDQQKRPIRPRR